MLSYRSTFSIKLDPKTILVLFSIIHASLSVPTPKPTLFLSNYTIFDKEFLVDLAVNDKRLEQGYGGKITENHILCFCSHHHVKDEVSEVINPYRPQEMEGIDLCIGTFCFGGKHFITPANPAEHPEFHEEDYGAHDAFQEDWNMLLFCKDELHHHRECCRKSFCNHDDFRDTIFYPMKHYEHPPEEPPSDAAASCDSSSMSGIVFLCVGLIIGVLLTLVCVCFEPCIPYKLREKLNSRFNISFSRKTRIETPSCNDHVPLTEQQPHEDDRETIITTSTGLSKYTSDAEHSDGSHQTQTTLSTTTESLCDDLGMTVSVGSGSGGQQLREQTFAQQLQLVELIGTGRFGEVHRGVFRGSAVAIKIFSTNDNTDFYHEVAMFTNCSLTHPNLVRYYGHDLRDSRGRIEYLLITEYHENGSVAEYLQKHTINGEVMFNMIRSIADGLSYLHSEIPNLRGKENEPKRPIAHRDIKSNNVLVKRDLTCTIADLGLSVKFDGATANVEQRPTSGTVRYHSPELLDEEGAVVSFDFYMRSDVYAMGLVMWEIARRTETGTVHSYPSEESIPYYDRVPRDPNDAEMRAVVLDEGYRPEIPAEWSRDPLFSRMSNLMRECWTFNPTARRTATSVRVACDQVARDLSLKIIQ